MDFQSPASTSNKKIVEIFKPIFSMNTIDPFREKMTILINIIHLINF